VHVVVGVDPENRMYLLDLWRGQTSSDVWIEAWCDLVKKCPCEAPPANAGFAQTVKVSSSSAHFRIALFIAPRVDFD
jgi:hypothetical protein